MNRNRRRLIFAGVVCGLLATTPVSLAQYRASTSNAPRVVPPDGIVHGSKGKSTPNVEVLQRWRNHLEPKLQAGKPGGPPLRAAEDERREILQGLDRVPVILVEFGGPDVFTFEPDGPNKSTWDPINELDSSEWTGTVGDCSEIVRQHNINGPTQFTYEGPLHNQIPRPETENNDSRKVLWREDFNAAYYNELLFGNGVVYDFDRQDGTHLRRDHTGQTATQFYDDMSGGRYNLQGDIYGWVKAPHSMMYYGADPCPGMNSGSSSSTADGGIPGAGDAKQLVIDAVKAVNDAYPNIDWTRYDQDGDGVVDRVWIVHAGVSAGEFWDVLDRTDYGEASFWPHASGISDRVEAGDGVFLGRYTIQAESSGLNVFVHEHGHTLGAIDLYPYEAGDDSTGFWSLMSDSWVGFPIKTDPISFDPYHLDMWGWLDPYVVNDTSKEHIVKVGQAGNFPGGDDVYRGVKIELPSHETPHRVSPNGNRYWWGGGQNLTNSMMTLRTPVALPTANPAELAFNLAYDIERDWDFLWVQVSADNGQSWQTLTNANTTCVHNAAWIGEQNGFPADMCAAGIGGFSGRGASYPAMAAETFDLSAYQGQQVLLRFWYMTDWGSLVDSVYLDDIRITANGQNVFADDAEQGNANWQLTGTWLHTVGTRYFTQNYYLQWRNVNGAGTVDKGLSDPDWRYTPANTGLLVWYNNNLYSDNEVARYLNEPPSFGPKGVMLVVDAHPEPWRDPWDIARGFDNEGANVRPRTQMRDAPFSLTPTIPYTLTEGWVEHPTAYGPRPAVPRFSDALGYYPGARFVDLGPGYDPASYAWVTEHWDASTVVPSSVNYPFNAPGFKQSDWFLYNCSPGGGFLNCNTVNSIEKPNQDGGSGNPGDAGGQHGWHVEILEQSDSQATLRIWNDKNVDMPPVAQITAPVMGAQVTGKTAVQAALSDDNGIARVEVWVDDGLRDTVTAQPFAYQWETAQEANGRHKLRLRACDAAGQCVWAETTVTVFNADGPHLAVQGLEHGGSVTGRVIVDADVSSGAGVASVDLIIDGVPIAQTRAAPWVIHWQTAETGAGYHTVTVRATDTANRTAEVNYTVYVQAAAGAPTMAAFTNGASFRQGPVAPNEIVTLWGTGLASQLVIADTNPPPAELGGATITFTDSAGTEHLGLQFFCSAGQTSLLAPGTLAPGPATVRIASEAGVATTQIWIGAVAPGLFAANQNGQGAPAGLALHVAVDGAQSFQYLFDENAAAGATTPAPVSLGEEGEQVYLILFGTGIRNYQRSVKVQVGGLDVPAVAVAQPQFAGLDQINAGPLPRALAGRGEVSVSVVVDGVTANTLIVNIE